MNFLGIHTYLGTFEHGLSLDPRIRTLGSIETWSQGIIARKLLRRDALDALPTERVDCVFMNPPCSRFSFQSARSYSSYQRNALETFDDLMFGIRLAGDVNAQALWWETGPLCWRSGEDMVIQSHEAFAAACGVGYDQVVTLTLRVDALWCGVPQLRPRVHVIHARRPSIFFKSSAMELRQLTKKGRLREYVGEAGPTDDPSLYGEIFKLLPEENNPQEQARLHHALRTMQCFKCCAYENSAPYSHSVNGRPFLWWEENRWWSIEEYCTLMGAPREWAPILAKGLLDKNLNVKPTTMLAKGVCAQVGRSVLDQFVLPTLLQEGEHSHNGSVQFDAPGVKTPIDQRRSSVQYKLKRGLV